MHACLLRRYYSAIYKVLPSVVWALLNIFPGQAESTPFSNGNKAFVPHRPTHLPRVGFPETFLELMCPASMPRKSVGGLYIGMVVTFSPKYHKRPGSLLRVWFAKLDLSRVLPTSLFVSPKNPANPDACRRKL